MASLGGSVSHALDQITPIDPWVSVQNTGPRPQPESFRETPSTPSGARDPASAACGKTPDISYLSTGCFLLGGHARWG